MAQITALYSKKYNCYTCKGSGYISDGSLEDGMLSGRAQCPTCSGSGEVTAEKIIEALKDIFVAITPADRHVK